MHETMGEDIVGTHRKIAICKSIRKEVILLLSPLIQEPKDVEEKTNIADTRPAILEEGSREVS